jgi:uncharacterized SAM-binding protein YcdF (DUF218 family)
MIEPFLQPSLLLGTLTAMAVVNLWRKRREGRARLWLVTAPLVALAVIAVPAVAHVALGSLEWQYPPPTELPDHPAALVVLSGYIFGPDPGTGRVMLGQDTFYQCLYALALYRRAGSCLMLASGGRCDGAPDGPTLAEVMKEFWVGLGANPADVLLEDQSTNTHENADACARLLRERGIGRIVLVTDARHMARAAGCFRRQGLEVVAAPCNYATVRFQCRWNDFLPSPQGVIGFQKAFHEWVGLVYYRLRGWI